MVPAPRLMRRVSSAASRLSVDDLQVEQLPCWSRAFVAHFLEAYWQKRPCVLRGALLGLPALSPDELAGLACSDEAPSRLITGGSDAVPWSLRRGPLDDLTFAELPDSCASQEGSVEALCLTYVPDWTLVVNGLDRAVPTIADALLPMFSFLPSWRIDDVQVSYAPGAGASVGYAQKVASGNSPGAAWLAFLCLGHTAHL